MNWRANGHDYGIWGDINLQVPQGGLQGQWDREMIQACDCKPLGVSWGCLIGQVRSHGARRHGLSDPPLMQSVSAATDQT